MTENFIMVPKECNGYFEHLGGWAFAEEEAERSVEEDTGQVWYKYKLLRSIE